MLTGGKIEFTVARDIVLPGTVAQEADDTLDDLDPGADEADATPAASDTTPTSAESPAEISSGTGGVSSNLLEVAIGAGD